MSKDIVPSSRRIHWVGTTLFRGRGGCAVSLLMSCFVGLTTPTSRCYSINSRFVWESEFAPSLPSYLQTGVATSVIGLTSLTLPVSIGLCGWPQPVRVSVDWLHGDGVSVRCLPINVFRPVFGITSPGNIWPSWSRLAIMAKSVRLMP